MPLDCIFWAESDWRSVKRKRSVKESRGINFRVEIVCADIKRQMIHGSRVHLDVNAVNLGRLCVEQPTHDIPAARINSCFLEVPIIDVEQRGAQLQAAVEGFAF